MEGSLLDYRKNWNLSTRLTYLLSYFSMGQRPSWEADRRAASQEILHILRKPKVQYRIQNCAPTVSVLSQLIPFHTPTTHLLKINLSIIPNLHLGLPVGLFPSGFPTKTLYTSLPFPIRATRSAHLIIFTFVIYKLMNICRWFSLITYQKRGTAIQAGRTRVRFSMVSLIIFIDIILPAVLWPWGLLSLGQKWVPEIYPEGKDGRCISIITLPPTCTEYPEIWKPQHPGTLRACSGLRFLYLHVMWRKCRQLRCCGCNSSFGIPLTLRNGV
jgi:hypothetical protein